MPAHIPPGSQLKDLTTTQLFLVSSQRRHDSPSFYVRLCPSIDLHSFFCSPFSLGIPTSYLRSTSNEIATEVMDSPIRSFYPLNAFTTEAMVETSIVRLHH